MFTCETSLAKSGELLSSHLQAHVDAVTTAVIAVAM